MSHNTMLILKYTCTRWIAKTIGTFIPIKKKIVFSSFFAKQYSCNPRVISEKMHDMYPEYEIVWLMNQYEDPYSVIPDWVRIVHHGDRFFALGREIASCFCYVYNCELSPNVSKKKRQLFIQTWHGDRGFKKILHDLYPVSQRPLPVYDNKVTDICMSGSSFGTSMYRTAFKYSGEIMQLGCPRNEKLLSTNEQEKDRIRSKLNLSASTKVLLFAPTFRDNSTSSQDTHVDLEDALHILTETGENWVCLIRAHLASCGIRFNCDGKHFIDASNYPDMTDLLSITDMLITDYSSCASDFALTGKPVIIAAFDIDDYTSGSRSFKMHPDESGFFTAHNQAELRYLLRTKTASDYRESYTLVNKNYHTTETGHATTEICKRIDQFYKSHFSK